MLSTRGKVASMSVTDRRSVNAVIRDQHTTENTLIPKLGITVGEYAALFLSLREKVAPGQQ